MESINKVKKFELKKDRSNYVIGGYPTDIRNGYAYDAYSDNNENGRIDTGDSFCLLETPIKVN